jgi:hypothetical protein
MLRTSRSRMRLLAVTGIAGVVAAIASVSLNASTAEASARSVPPLGSESPAVSLPTIPDAIKPPVGSKPIGAYLVVTGTQNYTCVLADGAATGAFTGASTPEAQLVGTGGRIHHFAGPSWQSERDGSLVTAAKVAASARTGTIPELLLKVVTHGGKGILDKADYINRLYTSGGVAPSTSCTAGQTVKVPYKAVYIFWDAAAGS